MSLLRLDYLKKKKTTVASAVAVVLLTLPWITLVGGSQSARHGALFGRVRGKGMRPANHCMVSLEVGLFTPPQ